MLLAGGQRRFVACTCAELEHVGPQAGRGVGDRQPHQVGALFVQVGVDLDRGVHLLALLVQFDQLRGRVNLHEQGQAFLALDGDLFCLGGGDVAVHLEQAVGVDTPDVLHIDPGAVGGLVVALGHLLKPFAGDGAAIGRAPFYGNTEKFGLCHGLGSLW
ncbi:hypothetical protein D3C84_492170 [compost metagenome]